MCGAIEKLHNDSGTHWEPMLTQIFSLFYIHYMCNQHWLHNGQLTNWMSIGHSWLNLLATFDISGNKNEKHGIMTASHYGILHSSLPVSLTVSVIYWRSDCIFFAMCKTSYSTLLKSLLLAKLMECLIICVLNLLQYHSPVGLWYCGIFAWERHLVTHTHTHTHTHTRLKSSKHNMVVLKKSNVRILVDVQVRHEVGWTIKQIILQAVECCRMCTVYKNLNGLNNSKACWSR